jgi:hypothetical protein
LPLELLKKSYEKLNNIDKKKLLHTKNIREIKNLLKKKIDNIVMMKKIYHVYDP